MIHPGSHLVPNVAPEEGICFGRSAPRGLTRNNESTSISEWDGLTARIAFQMLINGVSRKFLVCVVCVTYRRGGL